MSLARYVFEVTGGKGCMMCALNGLCVILVSKLIVLRLQT